MDFSVIGRESQRCAPLGCPKCKHVTDHVTDIIGPLGRPSLTRMRTQMTAHTSHWPDTQLRVSLRFSERELKKRHGQYFALTLGKDEWRMLFPHHYPRSYGIISVTEPF